MTGFGRSQVGAPSGLIVRPSAGLSAYRNTDDLRPRLRVLEELRACDRVIAGALATIANADASEPMESAWSDEGAVDLHKAEREADRAAAAREIMRALEHLRHALVRFDEVPAEVRGEWPQPSTTLRRYGRTVSVTGVEDQLQREVRVWFEALRRSDPRIPPTTPALTDWGADEPLAPVEREREIAPLVDDVQLAEVERESTGLARPRSYDFVITVVVGAAAFVVLQLLLERCWYGF